MRRRWHRSNFPLDPRLHFPSPGTVFACRPATFDIVLCEENFPRTTDYDDTELAQALNDRHQEIVPTQPEQDEIASLVPKVKESMRKIVIEEFRDVGSFRKRTMLAGHNVADIVVVLRSLPTVEAVTSLGQRIVEDLNANDSIVYNSMNRDFGCEISDSKASVCLLISTLPVNARLLDSDLHLKESYMILHMAALRHAMWFDENGQDPTIRIVIRLLKDIRNRFEQLFALNVWIIELLTHYAVLNKPSDQPLSVSQAFYRVLQMLSAGLLLPKSPALLDPCERDWRIHQSLTFEQMDQICSASQMLLRIMCNGGYKWVLGLEPSETNIITERRCWGGVVLTPPYLAHVDDALDPWFGDVMIDHPAGFEEKMEIFSGSFLYNIMIDRRERSATRDCPLSFIGERFAALFEILRDKTNGALLYNEDTQVERMNVRMSFESCIFNHILNVKDYYAHVEQSKQEIKHYTVKNNANELKLE